MSYSTPDQSSYLIPKPSLAKELGITSRTLSRWIEDPEMGFPEAVVINSRNYFVRAAVEAWKAERVKSSARIVSPAHLSAA